jgi:hypothetical protein
MKSDNQFTAEAIGRPLQTDMAVAPRSRLISQFGDCIDRPDSPQFPDPIRVLLAQSGKALEMAQQQINRLTSALQALVDLSDCGRPVDLEQVKRSLTHARQVLSATGRIAT